MENFIFCAVNNKSSSFSLEYISKIWRKNQTLTNTTQEELLSQKSLAREQTGAEKTNLPANYNI